MPDLLTYGYDPSAAIAPSMDVVRIAMQLRQQQAQEEAQNSRYAQSAIAAASAEQNRAREYQSTLDFNKAKTAEEQAIEAAKMGEQRRQFDLINAPFKMPSASPSASALAAVNGDPSQAFSLVNPDGSTSDTIQAPTQGVVRTGSVFGKVPDGAGGYMDDPNDKTDASVPGFDPNKGAWGANIKDPNLKGAAVSIDDMKAAGVDPNNPAGAMVQVTGADGVARQYPIVDKLGTPGRVDFTLGAYNELGGPQTRGGGLLPNLTTKIIPGGSAAPSAPAGVPPSQSVLRAIGQNMQDMGVPRNIAMQHLAAASTQLAAIDQRASARPVVRNMADGTTQQYDPQTGQWTTLATSANKLSNRGPVVRNMADGTTQQWDPSAGTWSVLASKPTGPQANYQLGDDGLWHDPSNPGAAFRRTDLGNGQSRFTQVVTPKADSEAMRISNFERQGNIRINPDDPSEAYLEKIVAGKQTYTPLQGMFQHAGGKIYAMGADGGLHQVQGVDSNDRPPVTITKSFQQLKNSALSASNALTAAANDTSEDGAAARQNAVAAMQRAQVGMQNLATLYPGLQKLMNPQGSQQPAGTTSQLKPMPPDVKAQAQASIATKGRPAVIQRLQALGYDTTGI